MIKKTIGGDRLGSGKKMQVDLKTYNRSTHDLGYIWRSTMSSGTLVPFMKKLALPGDTFEIDLNLDIKTHPTIGPLFGSYKAQIDIFQAPIRLYQSALHNNAIGIGMRMQDIKLPQIKTLVNQRDYSTLFRPELPLSEAVAYDPSSLLSHLNISGAGISMDALKTRSFNGVPYIAYWDIYKNYYANKQEEIGMFVDVSMLTPTSGFAESDSTSEDLPPEPTLATTPIALNAIVAIGCTFNGIPNESMANSIQIGINMGGAEPFYMNALTHFNNFYIEDGTIVFDNPKSTTQTDTVVNWRFNSAPSGLALQVNQFPLENIDDMREEILATGKYEQFEITSDSLLPYGEQFKRLGNGLSKSQYSQQGLALKTYQSDIFNNWMSTEWVDNATTGINAITAVDTSDGNFTIDALNLASKVYDMLNRIAISGGTYDDWLETVYTHEYINRAETPIYHGGLSKELVFQEVVSNSESESGQPLGTLAGKGVMSNKHKGGHVYIKIDEPSYIMGIVSLTPRIDYSQGNDWDVNLKTMDDLHKPALDEIGFQDLITEQMAYWTTQVDTFENPLYQSAGKQPAWINYMTAHNYTKGNFALSNNEMFMTLNRRYELIDQSGEEELIYNIKDLTTYIDPSKFNFIFADTDLTSQNFWVQIAADITARRKMSAKIMPNL